VVVVVSVFVIVEVEDVADVMVAVVDVSVADVIVDVPVADVADVMVAVVDVSVAEVADVIVALVIVAVVIVAVVSVVVSSEQSVPVLSEPQMQEPSLCATPLAEQVVSSVYVHPSPTYGVSHVHMPLASTLPLSLHVVSSVYSHFEPIAPLVHSHFSSENRVGFVVPPASKQDSNVVIRVVNVFAVVLHSDEPDAKYLPTTHSNPETPLIWLRATTLFLHFDEDVNKMVSFTFPTLA